VLVTSTFSESVYSVSDLNLSESVYSASDSSLFRVCVQC